MRTRTFTLFGLLFFLLCSTSIATAQNEKPKPLTVGVLNEKAVKLPLPEYPPAAKAVKAGGAVNVQIDVDVEGNVTSAKVVSGHPLLRKASENAAMQAKFQPHMLDGKAVKFSGILVYNFYNASPEKTAKEPAANEVEKDFVLNGRALKLPVPEFPPAAKAVRASGVVRVKVTVDEKGKVIDAAVLSGHPLLRAASEKAAFEAEFEPTLINGKASKITGVIVYNFVAPIPEKTEKPR